MSKRRAQAPIWTRPAPGTRRPRFTREQIAAVAIAIADKDGFAAVSMRRIADELGAGTMTLYHYVRTKDDLVALMDDALIASVLVPDAELPADWRDALTLISRRTRAVFMSHPWALHSLQGAHLGPAGMRHMEQSMAVVAGLPLDDAGKVALLGIVDDFVFGHVLRAAEIKGSPDGAGVARSVADFLRSQLDGGGFPQLRRLIGDRPTRASVERLAALMSDDEQFERGLSMVLDGAALTMGLAPREAKGTRGGQRRRTTVTAKARR